MYAIVEIQGQQFRAETGKKLYVHYLGDERKEGDLTIPHYDPNAPHIIDIEAEEF